MEKYYSIWKYNWDTKKIKNVDDFIETFKNLTQILKNFKNMGIHLDPNIKIDDEGITLYTANPEISNEENLKQEDSDELKEKKKFKYTLKVSVFSRNEIIRQRFFKDIDAHYGIELSKGMNPLKNMLIGSYETKDYDFIFQFWEFSNEKAFPSMRMVSDYVIGSRVIVIFYHIDESIDEDLLNLFKDNANSKIQILFVGYDSILSENPEDNDKNIQIIQKYYNEFNSIYISTDNQDCMTLVLDKIIELFLSLY